MKNKSINFFLFLIFILFEINGYSQQENKNQGIRKLKTKIDKTYDFSKGLIANDVIKEISKVSKNNNFKKGRSIFRDQKDSLGYRHERYKQYYKGVLVENSDIRMHFRNDTLVNINGSFAEINDLSVNPIISKNDAIRIAIKHIGAKKFIWEKDNGLIDSSVYPIAELLISKNFNNFEDSSLHLTYRIVIVGKEPESCDFVYIDANVGTVLFLRPTNYFVIGSADTHYNGTKEIETLYCPGLYALFDPNRKITTFDMNHDNSLSGEIEDYNFFVDLDNNWSSAEFENSNKDYAALDAHWGMMKTWDYFNTVFSRDSYDDDNAEIFNFVHWGINKNNSAWNSYYEIFEFGDGNDTVGAHVTLDIVAHEFGHAVCSSSADLIYNKESGAINEGLSDIWAVCVEQWATPEKDMWTIGDEIGYVIRDLSNPRGMNKPDTYGTVDDYWYDINGCTPNANTNDNCGVHTNSTVMGYWFYLLVSGGVDVNELGNEYKVSGIGITNASRIVYHAENAYMTEDSDFSDVREATILSAALLYGDYSQELVSVANAWNAVGVGNPYPCIESFLNQTVSTNRVIVGCDDIILNVQNVIVNNNAKFVIESDYQTILGTGFEVQAGAQFEVKTFE